MEIAGNIEEKSLLCQGLEAQEPRKQEAQLGLQPGSKS